jgi:hypothetical protein
MQKRISLCSYIAAVKEKNGAKWNWHINCCVALIARITPLNIKLI